MGILAGRCRRLLLAISVVVSAAGCDSSAVVSRAPADAGALLDSASDAGPATPGDASRGDTGTATDGVMGSDAELPDAGPGDAGAPVDGSAGADGAGTQDAGPGGPLLVIDEVYTHNTTTMAFSYFELRPGFPDNLVAPVDYAHGQLHQRLTIVSKPSDLAIRYQLCFFQDAHTSDNHACVAAFQVDAPGTSEQDVPLDGIWQYSVIDWSRSLLDLMLVVKDGTGNPVDTRYGFDGAWAGSPDLSLYYPMEVRFTAVLVPVGGTFTGFPP